MTPPQTAATIRCGRALMRHEEINDHREDNNAEHGETTKAVISRAISSTEGGPTGIVTSLALRKKRRSFSSNLVASPSNISSAKGRTQAIARDRKDRCERPDLRSVKAHSLYCFAQIR